MTIKEFVRKVEVRERTVVCLPVGRGKIPKTQTMAYCIVAKDMDTKEKSKPFYVTLEELKNCTDKTEILSRIEWKG